MISDKKKFTEWINSGNSKVDLKIKYFEHFVKSIISKTKDFEEFKKNDFSQLKMMELLFFTCSSNTELLKIFDDWWALPFGHVEKDIYLYMKQNNGNFSFFTITRSNLKLK